MADFLLTASHDLDFTTGDLQLVTGTDSIAQEIKIRMMFFKEEWFLDARLGMPYHQYILGAKLDLATWQGIYYRALSETPGVATIEEFEITGPDSNRQLTVTAALTSEDGESFDYTEVFIV